MTPESSPTDFDLFWAAYPKKKDKGVARKAWIQTAKIRPPLPVLLEAVEEGKRSTDWHKADREGNVGAFIPYPASWLRAEGWNDEYEIRLPSICNGRHDERVEAVVVQPPSEEQKEKVREMLKAVGLRMVV